MASFAQTIIAGNLGADPEVRYMQSGDAVCNFRVAVTESWKDKASGEKKEQTTWYRVNAYRKLAEICGEYLHKGSSVLLVGKMAERKWTDKEGQERTSWELNADSMQMLVGKRDDSQPKAAQEPRKAQDQSKSSGFGDLEDDLPF